MSTDSTTVYVSIGNSDDKLSQMDWSAYVSTVRLKINRLATRVHGEWFSRSDGMYQNACWCFEITDPPGDFIADLYTIRCEYGQDSIAWAVAQTRFI